MKIEESIPSLESGSAAVPGSRDTVTQSVELFSIPEDQPSVNTNTASASVNSVLDKIRTLARPISATSMLPPFDLEEYMEKRDVAKRSIFQIVNVQNKVGLLDAEK